MTLKADFRDFEIARLRRELAGRAATEVLERIAAAQSADPATDDLTVCLALEVADLEASNSRLRRENAALVEAATDAEHFVAANPHLAPHADTSPTLFKIRAALRSATEKGIEAVTRCSDCLASLPTQCTDVTCIHYRRSATEKGEPT